MRYYILLSLLLLSLCQLASANETHRVGASINYHLDQESSSGYGAFYQWQFAESIEFEANYIQSNDILLEKNDYNVKGDFTQFLLGANFIKQFNENLAIKAGSGISYVTTSSNEFLVEKQSIAPYLKLSANNVQ